MWSAPSHWQPMAGHGPASAGVWLVPGTPVVVAKRLLRPSASGDAHASDPASASYWLREVDLVQDERWHRLSGLRMPQLRWIEEDDAGVVFAVDHVESTPVNPQVLLHHLASFAAHASPGTSGECEHLLQQRLEMVEHRGGWTFLARTTAADVADALWRRRLRHLEELNGAVIGASHGDLTPSNVVAQDEHVTWAVDWAQAGSAPVGSDLGYWALASGEALDDVLPIYLDALSASDLTFTAEEVTRVAKIVAVHTAFTRADWALSRIAGGEGALAGKFNHPSVAAVLRGLARQGTSVGGLLGL